MGITILIKIRTDQQNDLEKETTEPQTPTDPQANPTEADPITQTITQVPTETTNEPRERDTKCIHYFGYVSSGDRIPEECLTCSKLLKCLTSNGGIQEEE